MMYVCFGQSPQVKENGNINILEEFTIDRKLLQIKSQNGTLVQIWPKAQV